MTNATSKDTTVSSEVQLVLEEESEQAAFTCRECKCSSTHEDGFQLSRQNSNRQDPICNTCAAYRQITATKSDNHFQTIIFFVFLVFMLLTDGVSHLVSFVVTLFLLLYAAIIIHELAHFFVTLSLGVRVRMLSLGSGPILKVFRIGQLFVVIRPLPLSGAVFPEFESREGVRKKFFLIVLAGPLSNLAMAISSAIFLYFYGASISYGAEDLLVTWIIMNAIFGVGNLFPQQCNTADGIFKSDGMHLREIPFWKNGDIDNLIQESKGLITQMECKYGDRLTAKAMANDAMELGQNLHIHSGILAITAKTDEEKRQAIKTIRETLESLNRDDDKTAIVRNNLAYSIFKLGDQTYFDEANQQSQKAMALLPMSLPVRSTRGSVLIAMGQYEEGLPLLEDERFAIETPENQASVLCARAIAYNALGREDEADASLKQAKALDPICDFLVDQREVSPEAFKKVF